LVKVGANSQSWAEEEQHKDEDKDKMRSWNHLNSTHIIGALCIKCMDRSNLEISCRVSIGWPEKSRNTKYIWECPKRDSLQSSWLTSIPWLDLIGPKEAWPIWSHK
jgi:hypothetical protein